MALDTIGAIESAPRLRMEWGGSAALNGNDALPWAVPQGNAVWNNSQLYIPLSQPATDDGENPTSYYFLGRTWPALTADAVLVDAGVNPERVAMLIVDSLWQGRYITFTTSQTQTISAPTLPARDINGSSNGEGCYAVLWNGTSSSTFDISYTNSGGTSGRTSSVAVGASSQGGPFVFPLVAGDKGVRSIQSLTCSAGSGAASVGIIRRVFHYVPSMQDQPPNRFAAPTSGLHNLSRAKSGAVLFPMFAAMGASVTVSAYAELAVDY